MEELKLSNKFTIFKSHYGDDNLRKKLMEVINLNHKLSNRSDSNSVWIEINSPILNEVNSMVKGLVESISKRTFGTFAEHYWVYTQKEGFNLEWMHQHILVHPDNRTTILTDYTFTYYVQIPSNLNGDEGKIVFETEDNSRHKFLPKEGDIFIFPSDVRHTAIPTPNHKTNRIVYAGSLCIDVTNQKTLEKSIL